MWQEMKRPGGDHMAESIYSCQAPIGRAASDYTVRVIPRLLGAAVPLEAEQILWQRP